MKKLMFLVVGQLSPVGPVVMIEPETRRMMMMVWKMMEIVVMSSSKDLVKVLVSLQVLQTPLIAPVLVLPRLACKKARACSLCRSN